MTDLHDDDQLVLVAKLVDDPVVSLPHSKAPGASGEFLNAGRERLRREGANPAHDPLALGTRLDLVELAGRGPLDLDPIAGHAA